MKDKTLYDKDSIQSLSPLEHVRLRPGMYVGSTKDSTQLLVELFSNALDEHNLGHGNVIEIGIDTKTGECIVSDQGQGFPLFEYREDGKTILQASFDEINTSGKYSDDGVYGGTSLGLNGVGGKAANFLAHYFIVTSYDGSSYEKITFKEGVFQKRERGKLDHLSGTTIVFKPSEEFFESPLPDISLLRKMFHDICGMCPSLQIIFSVDKKVEKIYHPEGLRYLVNQIIGKDKSISEPFFFQKQQDKYSIDCGLGYADKNSSHIVAYVNYGLTEQGPHITAIKTCITKIMNKWAREQNILKEKDKNLDGDSLQEGLVLVFNLVSPNISYDAQTKSRIVSKDFVPFLNEVFSEQLEVWLDNNLDSGKAIIEKAVLARRAAEAAKKAREAVKKKEEKKDNVFKLPTTLVDAWTKDRSKAELLICEGKSAMSGLVAARDSETQAIYGVRGMMISARKTTMDKLLKNQEVNNLIVALGLDFDSHNHLIYDKNKLRYDKIIACTDADPAGAAIENLLFNILWYICPELLLNGHVYSTIPPLFRVTTKKNEYIYLKNETALSEYQKKNGKKIQSIGRLKGLGEMDSEELEYTLLNPNTRNMVQLEVSDKDKTEQRFEMLYGKAVKPRVEYILAHSEEVEVDYE